MPDLFDTAFGFVSDAASAVGDVASTVGSAVGSAAGDVASGIGSAVSDVGTAVGSAASDVVSGAEEALGITPAVTTAATDALSTPAVPEQIASAGVSDVLPAPTTAPPMGPVSPAVSQALDQGIVDQVASAGAAPSDPLQQELDAAGINETGSNAAQVGTVDALLGGSGAGSGAGSAAGGAGSLLNFLEKPSTLLAAAPIALTLLRGESAVPPQISALAGPVTRPLVATERSQLAAANAGTLTPGMQATVAQYVQNQTNQLYQTLANEGVFDPRSDTRFIQGIADIQKNASILTAQFVQQEFDNAFKAAGAAAPNLIAAANAQIQEDDAFNQALSAAMTSAGLIAAFGSKAA